MNNTKLDELYNKMITVHEKGQAVFDTEGVPGMLKNEFRNKVSQYDEMYENLETMKALSSKPETIDNLVEQQLEMLNVRIKWEIEWATKALEYLRII